MGITCVDAVNLSWEQKGEKRFLKFSFHGHFSESLAQKTIEEWKKEFSDHVSSQEKISLIWHCEKMTGYDAGARKAWQAVMKELKENTGEIWIISSNTFLRTAARTMALLTRYKLHVAQSEAEIN